VVLRELKTGTLAEVQMSSEHAGQVVVVTGASGPIGAAAGVAGFFSSIACGGGTPGVIRY
jgi:hypothetical protein